MISLAGCASGSPAPPRGVDEPVEIAWLSVNRAGDANARVGMPAARSSAYVLLYNDAWIRSRTYGGPFEAFARKRGIPVTWKRLEPDAARSLFDFLWTRGFADLPGDGEVDWRRLEGAEVSNKLLVLTRGEVRHVVFFDDVTAPSGPGWDVFRDCENAVLDAFNAALEPTVQLRKDPPPLPK